MRRKSSKSTDRPVPFYFLVALAVAVGALAGGCRVETTVRVDVNDDGSGEVVLVIDLDADAVQAAEAGGGTLEQRVPLSDLSGAGWELGPWARDVDGSARLVATRAFAEPDEVAGIIAQIAGPEEPLRLTLTRDESFYAKRFDLKGAADLTGITVTGDQELVDRLTAEDVDVAALDQRLVTELTESYRLRVAARLPGAATTEWEIAPGEQVDIDASSTSLPVLKGFLLIAGIVLGALAVLLLVVGETRSRRRRRRATASTRRRATPGTRAAR